MSIATEITRLQNAKASLKTSLINKGVEVSDTAKLDEYAGYVDGIQAGGGSVEEYFETEIKQTTGSVASYIKQIPVIKVPTNMSKFFEDCFSLTEMPLLDTSKVTNMNYAFDGCEKLIELPLFDTSNVTNMNCAFQNCKLIKTIPQFNTSSVTIASTMFGSCSSLTTIPMLDFSNVTTVRGIVNYDYVLQNLGGFKDLGKAYLTTQSAEYTAYKLDLSHCKELTHESLMNVINNLYDIKTAGVQPQALVLGSTNLAKLTDAELQVLSDKGWLFA